MSVTPKQKKWRSGILILMVVFLILVLSEEGGNLIGDQQPPLLGEPQEEFVPIDQLPPEDQLPAAPLLVAAYGIIWLVVFGYLWSIWKRLSSVENELKTISNRLHND